MAIIYREIESLKTLKKELKKRGINRFNSIYEINLFIKQYDNEQFKIIENTKSEINQDVISKRDRIKNNKRQLKILIDNLTDELTNTIENYSKKITELESKHSNVIFGLINKFRHFRLTKKLDYINNNFNEIIHNKSIIIKEKILNDQYSIDYILNNKEKVLSKRSRNKIEKLTYINEALKGLYAHISGAIGESLVVKEIEKLPNDYILINDFELKFDRPIYNKQNDDRIYSIQIDHLLISPAGVFIIETKNWSEKSLNRYDLRSPVEQIRRTSYAMFVFLNKISDDFCDIGIHHWGESQIPLKNLIVMINNKPKNIFKFVKVLKLNELIKYVSHFDIIYSKNDVIRIADVLLGYNK